MKKSIGKQIVVIDNGFVHVGDCSMVTECGQSFVRIDACKNLRVWGTKAGLGELRDGPLRETKFDDCGTVLVPFGRVVFLLQVGEKW